MRLFTVLFSIYLLTVSSLSHAALLPLIHVNGKNGASEVISGYVTKREKTILNNGTQNAHKYYKISLIVTGILKSEDISVGQTIEFYYNHSLKKPAGSPHSAAIKPRTTIKVQLQIDRMGRYFLLEPDGINTI